MATVDLIMPKLGESIIEATILKWHKKAGDTVKQDETVLDIATDKVDSEVPATDAGIIKEILFKENDIVRIGTIIARIETTENFTEEKTITNGHSAAEPEEQTYIPFLPAQTQQESIPKSTGARFYSPLVLNIANSEGVNFNELENIPGTGNEGRVTKRDIIQYVADKKSGKFKDKEAIVEKVPAASANASDPAKTTIAPEEKPTPEPAKEPDVELATVYGDNVEIIEMDRMRKLISKHMVDSKHTSAHVTSFAEADVTNMVLWREKNETRF